MKLLLYAVEYWPLTFLWVTMGIASLYEAGFVTTLLIAISLASAKIVLDWVTSERRL